MRLSRTPLDATNFEEGTLVRKTPVPTEAGTEQAWSVGDLSPGTIYYFGLKVVDEVSNRGPVSNILKITTAAGIVD